MHTNAEASVRLATVCRYIEGCGPTRSLKLALTDGRCLHKSLGGLDPSSRGWQYALASLASGMTAGKQQVYAFEFEPVPALLVLAPAGQKVKAIACC